MIEELKPIYTITRNTEELGETLMNKINELVEAVNRMEKQIEKLQVL